MRKESSLVAARHKPHAAVFNAGVLHWKPAVLTKVFEIIILNISSYSVINLKFLSVFC